jgi:hypothetical protein
MPKFYVQCGPIQTILVADSAAHAASRALDATLQNHLWIYDDPGLSERDQHDHLMLEALLHLEPTIGVSEQGFSRPDAILIGTPETIEQWHQLMVGMNRLFVAAGLAPRTMGEVARSAAEPSPRPSRRPR